MGGVHNGSPCCMERDCSSPGAQWSAVPVLTSTAEHVQFLAHFGLYRNAVTSTYTRKQFFMPPWEIENFFLVRLGHVAGKCFFL